MREAQAFHSETPIEQGLMSILASNIDEYVATDCTPAPRHFTITPLPGGTSAKSSSTGIRTRGAKEMWPKCGQKQFGEASDQEARCAGNLINKGK